MPRRRDSRAVVAAALLAGTLVGQQVAAKTARDALFLAAFHVSSLPAMMLASAALSAVAAVVFARATRARPPGQSLQLGLGAFAALSLAGGTLSASWPRLVAGGFYLQTALFGAVLISAFWSVVNERFDPYSAKKAVAKIASGATLGGVIGGGATLAVARLVSPAGALLALALASTICIFLARGLGDAPGARSKPPGDPREIAAGFGLFRRTAYLKDLALLVGLGSLVEALLDYAFKFEAAARYSGGGALFNFFSSYAAATSLATFILQVLLTRPSLTHWGLGATVALQPGGVFLLSLLGAVEPGFVMATLARGGAAALRDSLFRSGYELLYTPLPPNLKRASKAVVDVAVDRLGTVLGSGLTLAAAVYLARPTGPLLALAAALAFVSAGLCRRLHQGYVHALEASLRSGVVDLDPELVVDSTTLAVSRTALSLDRQALLAEIDARRAEDAAAAGDPRSQGDPFLRAVADLRSGARDRVRAVLARPEGLEPALAAHVIALLGRRDVAAEAVRALRPLAGAITGQLVDALVDVRLETSVRRRVARVLKATPTPRAVEGLLLGLRDPASSVRMECGRALGALKAAKPALSVRKEDVFEAVLRELGPAAPAGDAAVLDHVFGLLSLVLETEPVLISLQALRADRTDLRGTALEYLDNVLPRAVHDALWPRLGAPAQAPAARRAPQEVESELLRSMSDVDAANLRRALLRPGRAAPGGESGE